MMNRTTVQVMSMMLAIAMAAANVIAQEKKGAASEPPKADATKSLCPVSGEAVDFYASTATDDGPVYFCCADCIGKYTADKAKYSTAVAAQRKALEPLPKIQVTCPVTGEPVDKKISIDHEGQKVYFTSQDAADKFRAEPAKYRSKLLNGYTYQTACPVMKKDINPKSFITLKGGQKVYFCCGSCDKKFLQDPAKYTVNLKAQGFTLEPAEVVRK